MTNNLCSKKDSIMYNKNKKYKHRVVSQKKSALFSFICLIIIILTAVFMTRAIYIYNNSKNLQFAVEYNLTTGFFSENKLLRVQTISLISSDDENATVEAFGLSKTEPHQSITITSIFKRGSDRIWYLDKVLDN